MRIGPLFWVTLASMGVVWLSVSRLWAIQGLVIVSVEELNQSPHKVLWTMFVDTPQQNNAEADRPMDVIQHAGFSKPFRLVQSIRLLAGSLAGSPIRVVCSRLPSDAVSNIFAQWNATVVESSTLSLWWTPALTPHAKKIAALLEDTPNDVDMVVLMDTDTVIVRDIAPVLVRGAFCAKASDMFKNIEPILNAAHVPAPPPESWISSTAQAGAHMMPPYWNSGVLAIPRDACDELARAWINATSFVSRLPLGAAQTPFSSLGQFNTDQYGLALAVLSSRLPYHTLPLEANLPVHHVSAHPSRDFLSPYVLHYHSRVESDGTIDASRAGSMSATAAADIVSALVCMTSPQPADPSEDVTTVTPAQTDPPADARAATRVRAPVCIVPMTSNSALSRPTNTSWAAPVIPIPLHDRCPSGCSFPNGLCTETGCVCCWKSATESYGGESCAIDNGNFGIDVHSRNFEEIYLANPTNEIDRTKRPSSEAGSSLSATAELRTALRRMWSALDIKTMIDAPCGDFSWMSTLVPDIEAAGLLYVGGDIAARLISHLQLEYWGHPNLRFIPFDIRLHRFWPVDLIMMRDVLFHLPPPHAIEALINVNNSGARFFVSTTFDHPGQPNPLTVQGYQRIPGWKYYYPIDLRQSPFNLGPPMEIIEKAAHRLVGVWQLPLWTTSSGPDAVPTVDPPL